MLESCHRLASVLAGKLRTLLLSCRELVLVAQQVGPSTRHLAAAGEVLADISRYQPRVGVQQPGTKEAVAQAAGPGVSGFILFT